MASNYTPPVQVLIDELGRLPGIGPKSAQRIAFHLLKVPAEDAARLHGSEVTSAAIGLAVLDELRAVDDVAYLRYASVYKNFQDPDDFDKLVQDLRPKDQAEE